jgi:hypothetical protein
MFFPVYSFMFMYPNLEILFIDVLLILIWRCLTYKIHNRIRPGLLKKIVRHGLYRCKSHGGPNV